MRSVLSAVLALSVFSAASAKQIVITVGGNTTTNTSAVFQPAQITNATIGDTLFFNFTQGNHTATQSTFAGPCIPAHETNSTINGFDSGFRDTVNGTAITNLVVPITDNNTIWFFDANTCAEGGVGGVNINDSSTETLDGFRRNAIRLNGTKSTTSASGSGSGSGTHTATSSRTSSTASGNTSNNGAERSVVLGLGAAVPMVLAALLL
ncbi:hypothetical protein K466DRAFT_588850 [Polyporus arcularius HHB13444]|uniref:Cupredoxin n=1 Tax=Polyporus arcularius HHB13444 TaxID=1314778 RepID=A0A5C3P7J3_9APHY|nr:hypothetical protein K466DRAFT_588850 [Polyporus arcularius HHB13444]